MFIEETSGGCTVRNETEYERPDAFKNMPGTHEESIELSNTYYGDNPGPFTYFTEEKNFSEEAGSKLFSLGLYPTSFRKPCNCAKSHCLKLYCECFARGSACDNCNCSNCMNNSLHDTDRRRAIKLTLERNPMAFHPKIGEGERKHSKGCNCKRSGCLKNYCECYEAKISCSDLCRCQGCRNFGDGKASRLPTDIQSTSAIRHKVSHKKSTSCFDCDPSHIGYGDDYIKLPHANQAFGGMLGVPYQNITYGCYHDEPQIPMGFLTMEIAEVACSCMIAQLGEAKQRDLSPVSQERIVIEEFGKCLEQIMESAVKLQQVSAVQDPEITSMYEQPSNPDFITVLPTDQGSVITDQGFQSINDSVNYQDGHESDLNFHSYVQYPISNAGAELYSYPDQFMQVCDGQVQYDGVEKLVVSLSNEQTHLSTTGQTGIELNYNNLQQVQNEAKFDSTFVEACDSVNNCYFQIQNIKVVEQDPQTDHLKVTQSYYSSSQASNFQGNDGVEMLVSERTEPIQAGGEICSSCYSVTHADRSQDVNDNCGYSKLNVLLKNSNLNSENVFTKSQDILVNDGEEEDEESHTATATLLNMSFQCENNRFSASSEIDLIGINEMNGTDCECSLNGSNQIRNFIVRSDTNSLLLHSNPNSMGNPFGGNAQHGHDIDLKPGLGFYDL